MTFEIEFLLASITSFMCVLARVSGLFLSLPGFSARFIPKKIKALVTFVIAFLISFNIKVNLDFEVFSLMSLVFVGSELLTGIAIGFIANIFLTGFLLVGKVVGMQVGIGFSNIVDPTSGLNVPALGQFYYTLAFILFFVFNGHLFFIHVLANSFNQINLGQALEANNYLVIAKYITEVFKFGLGLAITAVAALLFINFALGAMTRMAPQLNLFTIGFPLKMVTGLIIVWLTIANIGFHFENNFINMQKFTCTVFAC